MSLAAKVPLQTLGNNVKDYACTFLSSLLRKVSHKQITILKLQIRILAFGGETTHLIETEKVTETEEPLLDLFSEQ